MDFKVSNALEILEKTPDVLLLLTGSLSPEWTTRNEGEGTWSVFDVIGHLVHGEKTDWMVRAEIILSESDDRTFQPFDRFAQFEASRGKSFLQLLSEFKDLRTGNLDKLRSMSLDQRQLTRTGMHPTFGAVTLSQLLSTWVVHDLDHVGQISRIMAKQYKSETGPWIEFLKILRQ